ncbi:MAG: hypothetical protein R3C14_08510 [Caldilineaceae bacterium]
MDGYLVSLVSYLPLLIAYGVGLRMAWGRRAQQPQSANLAVWAFAILLVEVIAGNLLTTWLINGLNAANMSEPQANSAWQLILVNGLGVVRMLLHTLAIALLIRALFPAPADYVAPTWLRWGLGIGIGLILGGIAGALLGDTIGAALNISAFEGGRGYFVVLIVIPGLAVLGAVIGAFAVALQGRG